MDFLLLFTKHMDDTSCLCLKISSLGTILSPLELRNFAQIRLLQQECATFIIEPTSSAVFNELELPWLAEGKARIALPYALEDKVAQPVEELHFAFDKLRYYNNRYLIVIISKQRMRYLLALLNKEGIKFSLLTLDWFALSPYQSCMVETDLLINNDDFKGTLSGELALSYLAQHPLHPPLVFKDSKIVVENSISTSEESSYTWIAQKIIKSKPLNLCQGEMALNNNSAYIRKGYRLAGILGIIWLISLLIVNGLSVYFINKKINALDEQIAIIYHDFFPKATQVISPRFRISKLLAEHSSNKETPFWTLLNRLAKITNKNSVTIEQLRYQNNSLSLTVAAPDFASLEQFENKLQKAQFKVKQTQAATKDKQVVATLDLELE